jgi:hypothetical protein
MPSAREAKRSTYAPLAAGGFLLLLAGCAVPPARTASGETPPSNVDRLIGATPTSLEAELGPPFLLRRDGPAQVWLYRSARCAIDLILYRDPETGAPRVAMADARPLGTPLSDDACLASMAIQPSGRVASRSE